MQREKERERKREVKSEGGKKERKKERKKSGGKKNKREKGVTNLLMKSWLNFNERRVKEIGSKFNRTRGSEVIDKE